MSWQLARLVREQRRASRILAGMMRRPASVQAEQPKTTPIARGEPEAPAAQSGRRAAPGPVPKATHQAQAVLALLKRCAERIGDQFEVTARDIAGRTGLFIGAVPKALAELERRGEIGVRPSPAGGLVITMGRRRNAP